MCYFGIYRLMAEHAPAYAHRYRAGIIGYVVFGGCGFHVPVCAMVFFGKAWRCIGACLEICRILYPAGVCAVLDILRRFGDHADQSVCKGVDALSEMVLGVFSAGWYGGGNASNCVRQPTVGERHFLCVDQRGKCLDVRRSSRYDRRGAASAKSGLLIGILVNGKSKRKKEYK